MILNNVHLTEREAKVIRMRFGIGGQDPMTLEEVGRQFGVTRERIRQIENKALKKLRRSVMARELFENYIKNKDTSEHVDSGDYHVI